MAASRLWVGLFSLFCFSKQCQATRTSHLQDEPVEPSRISHMTSEELLKLVAKDRAFLLQIQRELLLVMNFQRRRPNHFRSKFRTFDKSAEAVYQGSISAGLTIAGLADMAGAARLALDIAKTANDVNGYLSLADRISMYLAAKINLLVTKGHATPSESSPDVTLGHLYKAYQTARHAVSNTLYADSQDWFKYTGSEAVPIFKSLTQLDVQASSLLPQEVFILDQEVRHVVPKRSVWKPPMLQTNRKNQTTTTTLDVGSYGRLGDGRGWVRKDVFSAEGGIGMLPAFGRSGRKVQAIHFTDKQKKHMCDNMQQKLNSMQLLPHDKTKEVVRIATSKTHAVTNSLAETITGSVFGVAMLGVGFAFPPSVPLLAVAMPIIGLLRTGVKTAAVVGFENMLEPLLYYLIIALVNLEFAIFEPSAKPRSGSKLCSFDVNWLKGFSDATGPLGRTYCDIIHSRCAAGQYCMRRGLFTHTLGQLRRKGYCMDASWTLYDNGFVCAQDEDCKSGVCHFGAQLPNSNFTAFANRGLLGAASMKDLSPEVKSMLGVCVEPCNPSRPECSKVPDHEFGFVPSSAVQRDL